MLSRKKIIYLVLSAAVSAILIWVLLSQITAEDLVQTFVNIHAPALLAFFAIALSAAGLRAWRYKWLLRPQRISWGSILLVTFIRNLFVDLLPARIGSLSYVYILNKRLNYAFEAAASTFVVAFVFDFLTLSPFLAFSIIAVGLGASAASSPPLLAIAVVFFLLILIILWKLPQIARLLLSSCRVLLKRLNLNQKKWAETSADKILLTIESLDHIKQRRIYGPVFVLSVGIRLAKYLSLYALLLALLWSRGFRLPTLSFWKTILGITGGEMTGALPIKGLGGFGTWESGWALAFRLMNFEPKVAILSGLGVHLITNLFEYCLGILAILILALPLMRNPKHNVPSQ